MAEDSCEEALPALATASEELAARGGAARRRLAAPGGCRGPPRRLAALAFAAVTGAVLVGRACWRPSAGVAARAREEEVLVLLDPNSGGTIVQLANSMKEDALCLEPTSNNTSQRPEDGGGLNVKIAPCVAGRALQQFIVPYGEKGTISPGLQPKSCFSVKGLEGKPKDKDEIVLFPCGQNNWSGQIWKMPTDGMGRICMYSDPLTCLDGSRIRKGTQLSLLQLKTHSNSSALDADELFILPDWRPLTATAAPTASANASGQVLDPQGGQPGNFGSLAEFWVSEEEIRQRVRTMVTQFNILEFQLYGAYEGFSHPPGHGRQSWECALEQRKVLRPTLEAAVDEVRKLGGRSWLAVHAAAVDPDDKALTKGQWVVPPEDVARQLDEVYFEVKARRLSGSEQGDLVEKHDTTYERTYEEMCGCDAGVNVADRVSPDPETRLMDVVLTNPAWALRFVPAWADFASALKVSGIHWESFGPFGHPTQQTGPKNPFHTGAPDPDIGGFLRAAKPILARRGLQQTTTFVDGFGWDPALMAESAGGYGRTIAFPIWEAWSPPSERQYFDAMAASPSGGFVLQEYPGYSKYHCCAKNERQNAGLHGVTPFEVGLRRWKKAAAAGGRYHFIVDAEKYLRGPYVPDTKMLQDNEVQQLQALANATLTMYAVGLEGHVFRQSIGNMTTQTDWELVSNTFVDCVAFYGGYIYAVTPEYTVGRQLLRNMTLNSPWQPWSDGPVLSVAVRGDDIYAVQEGKKLVKKKITDSATQAPWTLVKEMWDDIRAVTFSGDSLIGLSSDQIALMKPVNVINQASHWTPMSHTKLHSVAAVGPSVYGVDAAWRVVQQPLASMTEFTPWTPISQAGIRSIAIQGLGPSG